MPKIFYIPRNFSDKTQAIIKQANVIIDEYGAQGFDLTLRQLYYQFVARQEREHKRLLGIASEKWDALTQFKVFKKG